MFTSLVADLASLVIVVAVALLMGFRTGASVLGWPAVPDPVHPRPDMGRRDCRLSEKTVDGASAFVYPLIFLLFISSAFVSTETMPCPVAWFAENQPVTAIVNSIRPSSLSSPSDADIWIALAWCVGILVVAYLVATMIYRRKIS